MKVITWKGNWTIKPVIDAKQTHLKMCLSRCVAGDSWARLWFHRGALESCAGKCDQNVTESKQNRPACGFLVHPAKAGLCFKGNEPNAGWIRGMYSLPRRAVTTNMQICKCTPSSHSLQMDSWFVDSDYCGQKHFCPVCLILSREGNDLASPHECPGFVDWL